MLLPITAALSRLPLSLHYRMADWLLFPLLFYGVRYRRRMVEKNLRNAFPEKSDAERRQIEKAFYHQLCYTTVETIYGYHCSDAEIKERVIFENPELIIRAAQEYGGCVVMLAHMGNWEWMASIQQWLPADVLEVNIYRKQKNETMDKLMLAIRAKRGGVCVEKQRILREMIRFRAEKQSIVVGLISDQKPRPEVTRTWVDFLHQETGFLDGGEMLSKKFGYPVFVHVVRRTERGYYKTHFELISMDPKNTADGEITRAYAKALEANIQAQPELWLWTHNRWKWKRG